MFVIERRQKGDRVVGIDDAKTGEDDCVDGIDEEVDDVAENNIDDLTINEVTSDTVSQTQKCESLPDISKIRQSRKKTSDRIWRNRMDRY